MWSTLEEVIQVVYQQMELNATKAKDIVRANQAIMVIFSYWTNRDKLLQVDNNTQLLSKRVTLQVSKEWEDLFSQIVVPHRFPQIHPVTYLHKFSYLRIWNKVDLTQTVIRQSIITS
jgi:hypothetical protein